MALYGNSQPEVTVDKPETIDDVLNHLFALSDTVATVNFRIANAVAGPIPATASACTPTPIESSLLARLRDVRRTLQLAENDVYRTKNALGIQ